jgi:hypothetical protein
VNRQILANVLSPAAALALGIAAVAPFVETHGRLILEPDMPLADIKLYFDVLSGAAALPPSPPNVYFEGHSLIYALVMRIWALVAGAPADFDAAAGATINIVNAVTHALATMVVFAAVRRLVSSAAVALILTALFAIAPQVVDIDLVRIDRFMLLPLAVILHESVRIARGDPGRGIALGAALAVIAATKVTGAAFALFPAIAMLIAVRDRAERRRLARMVLVTIASGLPLFALLMIRFVLHPGTFLAGLAKGYEMQMSWTAIFAYTPRFYYNVDLFMGYGAPFLALAFIAFIIVAVRSPKDPAALWLAVCLAAFSALGVAAFKYPRGGYHLVPLYLFAMAIAAQAAAEHFAVRRRAVMAGAAVLLLIPAGVAARGFAQAAHVALARPQSIAASRFAARDWIKAHIPAGARICMMSGSQWANPVLKGMGFHVTTQIFDFPYLDRATMADFIPPRMDQVRAACDAIVFNDLHKNAYVGNFRTFGADDRLKEWQALFADLARDFPPKVFTAATPAYYVSQVEVYDLAQTREEPDPVTGARDTLTGAVDVVTRHGDKVSVQGWAADLAAGLAAGEIALVAEGRVAGIDGTGTARRGDVAQALKNPALQAAGFSTCMTLPDAAAVTVLARGVDGIWGRIGPEKAVAAADPDAPAPACESQE